MAFTYAPVKHTGKFASEIFSEIVEQANTTAKNLIRFFDNVKDEVNLTSMTGDVNFYKYKEDIRETDFATYTDTLAAADRTLTPRKMQSIVFFKMDDLRNTRFVDGMAAGAANIESKTFEEAVRAYLNPRYAKGFEKKIWVGITLATQAAIAASNTATASEKAWAAAQQPTANDVTDGLIAQSIVRNTISRTAAVITTSNLKTEYEKVLTDLPSAVLADSESLIFAPHSHKVMIDIFNSSQTYRGDIFRVSGESYSYLGKNIEFVPLPENCLVAGKGQEFGAATDLLADAVAFEVGKVNNVGDQMFGKLTCSLATDLVVETQKVLYI